MAKLPEMHCCSGYVAGYYSCVFLTHDHSPLQLLFQSMQVLVAGNFGVCATAKHFN